MKELTFPLNDANPEAELICYLHENNAQERPAVILAPGGAYVELSDQGDRVARMFYEKGFQAFVLRYSIRQKAAWPAPVAEAARAVQLVRSHAAEWGIGEHHIAIGGFSAGGGVSLCLGTLYRSEAVQAAAGYCGDDCRPDALIQVYTTYRRFPLLQADGSLGEYYADCLAAIDGNVPPAFWVSTYSDEVASAEYTLEACAAYSRANVPFELHMLTCGAHAVLTRPAVTDENGLRAGGLEDWFDRCCEWLNDLFYHNLADCRPVRTYYDPVNGMECPARTAK